MRKPKILTVDDDPDILDVLDLTLCEQFEVVQANNGKEGLEVARTSSPDLIITDYQMPQMTGPEMCKEIRKDMLLNQTPIIMLTGKGDNKDVIGGINAGADDYLIKPFEPETLLARINMILRRTVRSLDANPLTHLPGNATIMEELQNWMKEGKPFAVGYCDLDKFKIYNDKYGFEKGDDIIRAAARSIVESTQKMDETIFVGHIGGDDFVFICDDEKANSACERIIQKFDAQAPNFYNEEDRQAGFILGTDRQGNETKAGFVAMSIGIVSNVDRPINHVAEIAEIGAELKKKAKSYEGSYFVRDDRKE